MVTLGIIGVCRSRVPKFQSSTGAPFLVRTLERWNAGTLELWNLIVQSFVVRIAIGADHAGFLLKEHLKHTLTKLGHAVDDHGTTSEASVDYPPICMSVGRAVVDGTADRGIILGGSGQGEQIAANKVPGVRAALCNDLYTARLSREHNDANVLSMGGRIVAAGLADEILTLWLDTAFEGGRHQRRIDQITAAEKH
jgi:ribose 5-phosphate isomerase B